MPYRMLSTAGRLIHVAPPKGWALQWGGQQGILAKTLALGLRRQALGKRTLSKDILCSVEGWGDGQKGARGR